MNGLDVIPSNLNLTGVGPAYARSTPKECDIHEVEIKRPRETLEGLGLLSDVGKGLSLTPLKSGFKMKIN